MDKTLLKMVEMRLDGLTLQEIAEAVGVTRQNVWERLERVQTGLLERKRRGKRPNCVYPEITAWMQETECIVGDLARQCGVEHHVMSNILSGNRKRIPEALAKKIKEITGVNILACRKESSNA